jgi:hypothetical protein
MNLVYGEPLAEERNPAPCPACQSADTNHLGQRRDLPSTPLVIHSQVTPQSDLSALSQLELEKSSLRRLVVELLKKNQQLREQLRVAASGRNTAIGADITPQPQVDPQAA